MNTTTTITPLNKSEREALTQVATAHSLSVFNKTVAERNAITIKQYPSAPTPLLTKYRLMQLHATLLERHGIGLLSALGHITIEQAVTDITNFWIQLIDNTNNNITHLAEHNVIHTNELPYLLLSQWCLPRGCRREFSRLTSNINNEVFNSLWNGIVDLHRSRTFI